MDLLLKNGHVIDPAQNLDMITDIAIDNGCIAQIGVHLNTAAAKVIDLTGKVVCPGFVDLHTVVSEGVGSACPGAGRISQRDRKSVV